MKTVFGIDLTALVKLHGTERPIVVDKCISEIERRGNLGQEIRFEMFSVLHTVFALSNRNYFVVVGGKITAENF